MSAKREYHYNPSLGGWFDQHGQSPPTGAGNTLLLKSEHEDLDHSDQFVVMGLGYITAALPELRAMETPKILDAWLAFKKTMGK